MKLLHLYFSLLFITFSSSIIYAETIASPNGKIVLNFNLTSLGEPYYQVLLQNEIIVDNSKLGLRLEDSELSSGFKIENVSTSARKETWLPVWGENATIKNEFNELNVNLIEINGLKRKLTLIFRVFDDGVGFRYQFPYQSTLHHFVVKDELTEFALTGDHKCFWIPGDYDTNEYRYNTSKLSEIDASLGTKVDEIYAKTFFAKNAAQTPLTMKTMSGKYITIFEASLSNYPAMNVLIDKNTFKLKAHLVPDAVGNAAYLISPFSTPWRTILIGNRATDILDSKIILNLNEPCKIENTSWIKPMKYVGIWWEMHIGKSTWDYAGSQDGNNVKYKKPSGKHGATTEKTKYYIDFAAKHGFNGVLIEGWNEGWEDWFGKWKEDVFDFITPYPDFNVSELSEYAASKGVKMIMHNETSASVTNYERRMKDAYEFMKKYNYPAVKTGYVGRIIPRGEHHDGQWMVNHYERVASETAKNQIMLCSHESVRPTGLQRTYPNWLACEAARGQEFNAWSDGNLPEHETILPFTRLLGGPMDYTPGIFSIKLNQFDKNKTEQVHSTLAKQLALYVTLYSPLQMAADLPENYEKKLDAFQFIKDVPVEWDLSKYIDAEIGDFIIAVRREKGKDNWYLGAITDENARTKELKLDFLSPDKKYEATIYRDNDKSHWKDNPEAYSIDTKTVDSNDKLTIKMAAGGGCAISFKEKK